VANSGGQWLAGFQATFSAMIWCWNAVIDRKQRAREKKFSMPIVPPVLEHGSKLRRKPNSKFKQRASHANFATVEVITMNEGPQVRLDPQAWDAGFAAGKAGESSDACPTSH